MFFRPWSPLHLCLHILCCENCIWIVYDKMLRGIVVNDNLIGSVAARSSFHGNAVFFANFRWPFVRFSSGVSARSIIPISVSYVRIPE